MVFKSGSSSSLLSVFPLISQQTHGLLPRGHLATFDRFSLNPRAFCPELSRAIPQNAFGLNFSIFFPFALDRDVTLWYYAFVNSERSATVSRHAALHKLAQLQYSLNLFPFIHFHTLCAQRSARNSFCINHFRSLFRATEGWGSSPFCTSHQSRITSRVALTSLECAVTRFRAVTSLECAVTKTSPRKPFRMRRSIKRWGGSIRRDMEVSDLQLFDPSTLTWNPLLEPLSYCARTGAVPQSHRYQESCIRAKYWETKPLLSVSKILRADSGSGKRLSPGPGKAVDPR